MPNFDAVVRARIDKDIKDSAEKVLASIGLEPSDAIRLFYTQIANRGEFPLELRVPNKETKDAMNADALPETYQTSNELFDSVLVEKK